MNKIVLPFSSALFGGLIVLVGLHFYQKSNGTTDQAPTNTQQVSYSYTAPFDFTDCAEIAMPAVVHIKASESTQSARERLYNQRRQFFDPFSFFFGQHEGSRANHVQIGYGSGVIINRSGLIVTNNHVVDFADELEVTLHDNRSYTAKLIGTDPKSDLALIQIESQDKFNYLEFGNSDQVKVGQWVAAVGNPFDLTSTVTAGIVSAKGRNNILSAENAIEDFIQTDAVVNQGNSGGALLDVKGKLIGINTAIASPDGLYAGYAFAIPSNLVDNIIDKIKRDSQSRSKKPGYLGIDVEEVNQETIEEYQLYAESGVVIVAMDRQGPAYFGGLELGDVVIEIDDETVRQLDDISRIMRTKYADTKVTFSIIRRGKLLEVPIILKTE